MTARLGKPFGYPAPRPAPKPVSDIPFLLAVFATGIAVGAAAAFLVVYGWAR